MKTFLKSLLLLSIATSLFTACGFQPRGKIYSLDDLNSLYVNGGGASRLNSALSTLFTNGNVTPQSSPDTAAYILTLANEQFDRRVLSVSPNTGKVEEYELQYKANMNLTDSNGNILINNEPILADRNFVFNENAVLSSFSEEGVLQADLAKTVASQVLRRVQAAIKNSK